MQAKIFAAAQTRVLAIATLAGIMSTSLLALGAHGATALPADPQRIVVLNLPALGDPLLTLGYDLVAAPGADQPQNFLYLPEGTLDRVTNLGTAREIDLEAVVGAEPDLIIATDQNGEILPLLEEIAPTLVVDTSNIGNDRWTILEQLAEALHASEALETYRGEYEARIEELRPQFESNSVSFVRLVPDALLTYHGNSPIGDVLGDLGLEVTSAEAGVGTASGGDNYIVSLSLEQVGTLTGDYLIVYTENLSRQDAEAMIASPLWQTIPAVSADNAALIVKSETDFLLLPWGRYGTMRDLDVLEDALLPLLD